MWWWWWMLPKQMKCSSREIPPALPVCPFTLFRPPPVGGCECAGVVIAAPTWRRLGSTSKTRSIGCAIRYHIENS